MYKNKAIIISIILSCLAILLSIFAWASFVNQNMSDELFLALNKKWFIVMLFYFLATLAFAIIGLIMGIKKIKTGNRPAAILAIIISILSILITIFSGYLVEFSIILQTT